MEIDNPLGTIAEKIEFWVEGFMAMLPNLAVAAVVFVAFIYVTRYSRRLVGRVVRRISHNTLIQRLVVNTAGIVILSLGIFIVLGILNLDKTVTSLLAGIGVVGLILGFAFQDIASNFVAGLILATRTPFRIGDLVEANGTTGKVINTNLRFTTILTYNGQEVYIPNKLLINESITNYSAEGVIRVEVTVGVSYAENLRNVKSVAERAVRNVEGVLHERGIDALFEAFDDSSINFTLRFWIELPDNVTLLRKRSEAIIAIKEAFDQNGITIPFPIRTLDFDIKGGKRLDEVAPLFKARD